jgi:hypothetical protein
MIKAFGAIAPPLYGGVGDKIATVVAIWKPWVVKKANGNNWFE